MSNDFSVMKLAVTTLKRAILRQEGRFNKQVLGDILATIVDLFSLAMELESKRYSSYLQRLAVHVSSCLTNEMKVLQSFLDNPETKTAVPKMDTVFICRTQNEVDEEVKYTKIELMKQESKEHIDQLKQLLVKTEYKSVNDLLEQHDNLYPKRSYSHSAETNFEIQMTSILNGLDLLQEYTNPKARSIAFFALFTIFFNIAIAALATTTEGTSLSDEVRYINNTLRTQMKHVIACQQGM